MKICILSTSYPRSKGDHWVPFMHSWARELAKTEDVTVVTSGGPGTKDYEERDNVKIHRFNYFYPKRLQKLTYSGGMKESFRQEFLPRVQAPFFMLSFLFKSLKVAKDCDVINAHWTLSGLAALPARFFYKKPIVLTEHGGGIRGLPKWLNRFVLRRMDMITSAHYDIIEEIRKMGAKNVADVKNFLDEEKFLRKHDANSIKRKLGIKNENVVAFIGRFEELKDPLTFVESVHYASGKSTKFIMVGDGHLKQEIQDKIRELNIEIILPGPTSDVDEFLAVSDVFVACSATENCFSTTILEAMLSKVPCIITKAGVTEKFFIHKKDAYLVNKKNPEDLAKGVIDLLRDVKLRKKLSENSLKFLGRYGFKNKIIKEKIMKALKDVMKT